MRLLPSSTLSDASTPGRKVTTWSCPPTARSASLPVKFSRTSMSPCPTQPNRGRRLRERTHRLDRPRLRFDAAPPLVAPLWPKLTGHHPQRKRPRDGATGVLAHRRGAETPPCPPTQHCIKETRGGN